MEKRKKNGFTLIELLVVITILALVASLSFILYNNYSDGAKETVSKITEQNLVSAAQIYAKEFKEDEKWYEELVDNVPTGNYFTCTTIRQLKNKGILKGKLVDAVTGEEIDDDTTIKLTRDPNKVITSKIEKDSLDCDRTPPEFTITYDGEKVGDWYTGELKYSIVPKYGYSGISEFKYYIEISGSRTNLTDVDDKFVYNGKIANTVSSDNIKVCAWAINGNDVESETVCEPAKLDNVPVTKPNVTASDGITSGNWHKNTFVLNVSGGGNPLSGKFYEYRKNSDTNYVKVSNNKINIAEADHTKTIYVRTCNNIGKCSDEASYKVNIDKEIPQISNVSKSTSSYVSSLNITATIKDSVSGIAKYKIDRNSSYTTSGWTTVSGTVNSKNISSSVSSNGTYYVWVQDKAGNYSKSSISISNIASLRSTTVDLESSSRTINSNKYISGIKAISSVTTNNGSISNYYKSGSYVYFTVGGGSSSTVWEEEYVTEPADREWPDTRETCECDSGDRLQGRICRSSKTTPLLVNRQCKEYLCQNNRWLEGVGCSTNISYDTCENHDYYGYTKIESSAGCPNYPTPSSCSPNGSRRTFYRNCTFRCKKNDYAADCWDTEECPRGYDYYSGGMCYACEGSFNSRNKTCSYYKDVAKTVYKYRLTIYYYA